MPRLLLLSNSRNPGQEFLAHALPAIADLLGPAPKRLAFIPYAAVTTSYDEYTTRVREAIAPLGHAVESVHEDEPVEVLREADAIVVGGGNTFRLLERLAAVALLDRIRARVRDGVPYLGWSAGANLACPTIRTTNDMPIVEPPSFAALSLLPFQINPHFTDATLPNHGGETRADRIAEFLAMNPELRVVGLREGSWLSKRGASLTLHGPHPMAVFEAGLERREVGPGSDLDFLMQPVSG
jgi:dipeptidase E